jgi:hypothetical protein
MTLPKVNKTKILTVVVFLLLLGASLSMFRANYDCSTTNGFYGCARAEELAKYHETRPYFERLSTDKGRWNKKNTIRKVTKSGWATVVA